MKKIINIIDDFFHGFSGLVGLERDKRRLPVASFSQSQDNEVDKFCRSESWDEQEQNAVYEAKVPPPEPRLFDIDKYTLLFVGNPNLYLK